MRISDWSSDVCSSDLCTPYIGPRSPRSSAHSFQMLTPRSCSQRTFESPRKNHNSSIKMLLVCSFLVVISGEPSPRSKRIWRSEEHTSELQSLMRISYAVFCLKKQLNLRPTTL